jgi:hypothetical protein
MKANRSLIAVNREMHSTIGRHFEAAKQRFGAALSIDDDRECARLSE